MCVCNSRCVRARPRAWVVRERASGQTKEGTRTRAFVDDRGTRDPPTRPTRRVVRHFDAGDRTLGEKTSQMIVTFDANGISWLIRQETVHM